MNALKATALAAIAAVALAAAPAPASAGPHWHGGGGGHWGGHGGWGHGGGWGHRGWGGPALVFGLAGAALAAGIVADECVSYAPVYDDFGNVVGRRPVNAC